MAGLSFGVNVCNRLASLWLESILPSVVLLHDVPEALHFTPFFVPSLVVAHHSFELLKFGRLLVQLVSFLSIDLLLEN